MTFKYMTDGVGFRITLAGAGTTLEEVQMTPPGVMGQRINMTTLRNVDWETYAFQKLKDLSEAGARVVYNVGAYSSIIGSIHQNQQFTLTFPDNKGTITFWGAVTSFKPAGSGKGARPEADVVISPSNTDNSGNEAAPTISPA